MVFFEGVKGAPVDPILGLTAAFEADERAEKVNLSVGMFRTEELRTPVLKCVKMAEALLLEEERSKEYLPIDGSPEYVGLVEELIFG